MAHDVMISHSNKDKPAADAACAALEARGIRCWIAPRDINPGQDWAASILRAIRDARIVLLIFSRHANESLQVRREVERAAHSGKVLLPLRIDDVLPEETLEFFLSTPHWLDAITPPFEAHLEKLADACSSLLAVTGRSPDVATSPITGISPSQGVTATVAGDPDISAADQDAGTASETPEVEHPDQLASLTPSFTDKKRHPPDPGQGRDDTATDTLRHRGSTGIQPAASAEPATTDTTPATESPPSLTAPTDHSDQAAAPRDIDRGNWNSAPDTDTTPNTPPAPARDPGTTPAALANPTRPSARQPLLQRLSGRTKIAAAAGVIAVIAAVIVAVKAGQQPPQVLPQPAQASRQTALPFTGLDLPEGVAVDAAGTLYVTDPGNKRVLTLAAGSSTQSVLPFTGLNLPDGVAVDTAGTLYVTDPGTNYVSAPGNKRVLTLAAGSSTQSVLPFTGLNLPDGVAVDTAGTLYVTDFGNHRVLKLAAGANTATVLPFTGLGNPQGVAVDTAGTLYVTDADTNQVLKLAAGANTATVLPFTVGGPHGVAVDTAGTVYVTGYGSNQVQKLAAGANTATVLPFTGLNQPTGVAVDAAGNLYVTDYRNNRVLKLPAGS
jgi:sugar lactone lactonase YvrE